MSALRSTAGARKRQLRGTRKPARSSTRGRAPLLCPKVEGSTPLGTGAGGIWADGRGGARGDDYGRRPRRHSPGKSGPAPAGAGGPGQAGGGDAPAVGGEGDLVGHGDAHAQQPARAAAGLR
eukprot:1831521-Pyramimonas_sp.AAC.2